MSDSVSNPLSERYAGQAMRKLFADDGPPAIHQLASEDMQKLFSDQHRILGWRKIWFTLAKTQAKLGLPWPVSSLQALESIIDQVDLDRIHCLERETRHDVMAALHEFCEKAEAHTPGSSGILHAGATSCLVTDNQDLLTMRLAIDLLHERLLVLADSHELDRISSELSWRQFSIFARGTKGTTGTQASYLELFQGKSDRVRALDEEFSMALGFEKPFALTSQTYPRLVDFQILSTLAITGRLLVKADESDPVLRDLAGNLERFALSACEMGGVQWLERSLDDSAQRRIIIPEAFLSLDALFQRLMDLKVKGGPPAALSLIPRDHRKALGLIRESLVNCIARLAVYATYYRDLACLCYTHYQVAQPATVGRRFCLWNYSLVLVLGEIERLLDTGKESETSDGILVLQVEGVLNQLALVSSKIAGDLRLLQHDGELSEPFGKSQVGSSAMPYKRNPMRSERLSSLARLKWGAIAYSVAPSQALLNVDALLQILLSLFQGEPGSSEGFQVHETVIRLRFEEMAPFLSTEVYLMRGVLDGQDRQLLHEKIRRAMLLSRQDTDRGDRNSFQERLESEKVLTGIEAEVSLEAQLGRSQAQVDEFTNEICSPILERYGNILGLQGEVRI
jgi:adenylosuccinate lyase